MSPQEKACDENGERCEKRATSQTHSVLVEGVSAIGGIADAA
jgi:hypothetical protein